VLFSYALLPPFPVLVVLVCLLGVVMARDWNRMVRVYARAQAALRDTLADNTAEHSHAPQPVKDLLETVGLRTLTIEPNAPAAGKLIRELEVRRLTGAYIIGIERDGEAMINPSPDEELNVGDKVVLLGEDSQLSKAADLMLLAAY
jgi:K+/H+ antiporter YhaU regulatory subunit KhtT